MYGLYLAASAGLEVFRQKDIKLQTGGIHPSRCNIVPVSIKIDISGLSCLGETPLDGVGVDTGSG